MNSRMAKVKLASAKASWAEAARTNGDALNIDEFLAFTHPESSHSLMAQTGRQKPKFTLRYYILLSRHIVSTKKVVGGKITDMQIHILLKIFNYAPHVGSLHCEIVVQLFPFASIGTPAFR